MTSFHSGPKGYGGTDLEDAVVVPGFSHVLLPSFINDNGLPEDVEATVALFEKARVMFPNAEVRSTGYDDFVEALEAWREAQHGGKPNVRGELGNEDPPVGRAGEEVPRLPRIVGEIGDVWMYGVPSDPVRVAKFRVLIRESQAWFWEKYDGKFEKLFLAPDKMNSGAGDEVDEQLPAFVRFLILVIGNFEHTWGGAAFTLLNKPPFDKAWRNKDFDYQRKKNPILFEEEIDLQYLEQRQLQIEGPLEQILDMEIPELAGRIRAKWRAELDPDADREVGRTTSSAPHRAEDGGRRLEGAVPLPAGFEVAWGEEQQSTAMLTEQDPRATTPLVVESTRTTSTNKNSTTTARRYPPQDVLTPITVNLSDGRHVCISQHGALLSLTRCSDHHGAAPPLAGDYVYRTYSRADMKEFAREFYRSADLVDTEVGQQKPGLPADVGGEIFRPSVDRVLVGLSLPTVVVHLSMPRTAWVDYGAPKQVRLKYEFDDVLPVGGDQHAAADSPKVQKARRTVSFHVQLYTFDKRPTRLPEAQFLLFGIPTQTKKCFVRKLEQLVDVVEVIRNGSMHMHGAHAGGEEAEFVCHGENYPPVARPIGVGSSCAAMS